MNIESILQKEDLSRADLLQLLSAEGPLASELIRRRAYEVKLKYVGNKVYFRGIVELSNFCSKNCTYCGIRKGNTLVHRFQMSQEQVLKNIQWAHENQYGSVVLQSGERQDTQFIAYIEGLLDGIREAGQGQLGVTLSLGEQSLETYQRWFQKGGHRYLLRVETSNPELYRQLHPSDHSFGKRLQCLKDLKTAGYQVGTGVMIGLPGQTLEDLADDLLFFKANDIDMIGMGPYVVHGDTPLAACAPNTSADQQRRLELGLRMISLTRILLKDVNIAATTALQALDPLGREKGLLAGANVIMPILTDLEYRKDYLLYDGKPCVEDSAGHCKDCIEARIRGIGETIAYGERGDPLHYSRRVR